MVVWSVPRRCTRSVSEINARESMQSLVDRGSVWIDPDRVVRCRVEGPVSIIKLVSEGTMVKKGDLVCELDASGLRRRLGEITIVARGAEGESRDAGVAREVEACRDQIALCKLYAQADGQVVLAGDPGPNAHGKRLQQGAIVKRPDEILSVFDVDGAIRVTTKVPEKLLEHVKKGQRARITFDAFPQKVLPGVVADISPLPDPSMGGRLAGFYTVGVEIARGFPGLRPEMGARVEILLDGLGAPQPLGQSQMGP